jgi:DNA-directed RNA polymerase specialized sigma24 family protein
MMLKPGIDQLSALCQQPSGRPEAFEVFYSLFPLVPHAKDDIFLPAYTVRRILQMQEFLDLDPAARLRLADWASEAVLNYIAEAANQPEHAVRTRLYEKLSQAKLDFGVLPALRLATESLREINPLSDLAFRLIYLAGEEAATVADCMNSDPESVTESTLTAEAWIEGQLRAENPLWTIKKLGDMGIRPPGTTTRILDEVRNKNAHIWAAISSPAFLQSLPKSVRESSLISEVILRTERGPARVPEDTERLRRYIGTIVFNLQRERLRNSGREQALEQQTEDGQTLDASAQDTHDDWLLQSLIISRQDKIVEAYRRVYEMFRVDRSDLMETFQLCFIEGRSNREAAEAMGIDVATVVRRKRAIQEYFETHLASEGLDTGHYRSPLRSKRLENLFQLIEAFLSRKDWPTRRPDRRVFMLESLAEMSESEPRFFAVLEESYLNDDLPVSELAARRTISTNQYRELQKEAKLHLAQLVNRMTEKYTDSGSEVQG